MSKRMCDLEDCAPPPTGRGKISSGTSYRLFFGSKILTWIRESVKDYVIGHDQLVLFNTSTKCGEYTVVIGNFQSQFRDIGPVDITSFPCQRQVCGER